MLRRVQREVERNALRARNGIKLAVGVDRPDVGCTPKDVVWERDRVQLWRYRSDHVRYSPPLLIVFSLISRSYVLDLHAGNSFVERLRDAGFDVFLLDWGVADERDAGNRLEDYVDGYLPAGVREVLRAAGTADLNLLGYCFGGVLTVLSVAGHGDLPIRSLTTVATPTDFTRMGTFTEMLRDGRLDTDVLLDETGNVPSNIMRQAFRVLRPTAEVTVYVNLLEHMWNDDYLLAYQTMMQWTGDHIPFPGAAARQTLDMLVRDNAILADRVRLGGRPIHLREITCPFLNIVATRDHVVPAAAALPLLDLVGSTDRDELRLDAGHIGLVVGRSAGKVTIPKIIDFLRQRSDVLDASEEDS
jgi:polyhydroxyalkanoate synthase subunit PhaC